MGVIYLDDSEITIKNSIFFFTVFPLLLNSIQFNADNRNINGEIII
jgi:hypothetical protein